MPEVFDEIKEQLSQRGLPRVWPPYQPDTTVAERLLRLNPQDLTSDIIRKPDYAAATVAGLLLWADCLEESHRLSQEISSTTGSFWHGIMHRREPDYSNARYWFGRFTDHPAFPEIYQEVLADLEADGSEGCLQLRNEIRRWGTWNATMFVGLVEEAAEPGGSAREEAAESKHSAREEAAESGDSAREHALEVAQLAEIQTLLDWTYREAITGESDRPINIG